MSPRYQILLIVLALGAGGVALRHFLGGRPMDSYPSPVEVGMSAATAAPLDFALSAISPGAGARDELRAWKSKLLAMPKEQAVEWLVRHLRLGEDRITGLSFSVESDGFLGEWPTVRTFLLDVLLAVDPAAAAEFGREILASPTTADEWALALRNVARGDDSAQTAVYLREKTEALIRNPGWQAAPSVGYLNAFDVLVHIEAVESTPLLSSLVQLKERRDLSHASFLTLDRLVQRRPAEVLEHLAGDLALHETRPEMVAQQFARADLRDERQREIVKSWLLDPSRTATELRTFAGTYPNANRFVSNNLLTTEPQVSGGELADHDREALGLMRSWQGDPAFSGISDYLAAVTRRLNEFAGRRDPEPDASPTD